MHWVIPDYCTADTPSKHVYDFYKQNDIPTNEWRQSTGNERKSTVNGGKSINCFTKKFNLTIKCVTKGTQYMQSTKLVLQSHFISGKNSFSDISRKYISPNIIWAKPAVPALIIFSKMHFLQITENESFKK